MEFREKCARILRSIIGWFLIVLGGLWGTSVIIDAIVVLFGGMGSDFFGDRLPVVATSLMIAAGSFTILWLGLRLKNSGRREKTAPPVKRKSSPANQKETHQSTDERRLQREKEEILRAKRTAYACKITVQDALNTFSEEEQQRFENRRYQYTQDTGRAGLSPEIAAANRGMVFVDGRPVAKEVAAQLDEMRNAVSSDNAAMISEKEFAPVFIPNLAGYQMKMHTDSGEEHCFTLTGLKAYYPNMSSMCGYGSDEWCFHCKYNGENYILRFCDDAGYGTIWDCALINKENAEQLEKLSVVEWLKLVLKSETKIFHLHPDMIDAAKNIVQDTSSRCGPISDNGFYGR